MVMIGLALGVACTGSWLVFFHVFFRTPWKINGWNLQITHLNRKMIFQTSMIAFHVNLQG